MAATQLHGIGFEVKGPDGKAVVPYKREFPAIPGLAYTQGVTIKQPGHYAVTVTIQYLNQGKDSTYASKINAETCPGALATVGSYG